MLTAMKMMTTFMVTCHLLLSLTIELRRKCKWEGLLLVELPEAADLI